MTDPRWLDRDEDRAWRGWLAMSGLLRISIDRDLQSECGLSSPELGVLVLLSETAGGRMRMSELATALRWSKSRVSHQCSRMQARGLVAREGCPGDARSAYAVLTASGHDEIVRAAPLHVDSVRRHLIDLLDPDQVRALGAIAERVLEGHAGLAACRDGGAGAGDDTCGGDPLAGEGCGGDPEAGEGSSGDLATGDGGGCDPTTP